MEILNSMQLSEYQKNILNELKNGSSNILVEAKAGSGKTSTLLLIAKEIFSKNKQCLFLSFSKSISEELKLKIPDRRCEIRTLHSLGYAYIQYYYYKRFNRICKDRAFR